MIAGKVSVRERNDREEHSILCDKILPFGEEHIDKVAGMLKSGIWFDDGFEDDQPGVAVGEQTGLSIVVPERPSHEMIDTLRKVLKESSGRERVYLVVQSGERKQRIETEYCVKKTPELIDGLKKIVGEKNVY